MQVRNNPHGFPWTGSLMLGAAVAAAGLLLLRVPNELAALTQPWYLSRAAGLVAYTLLWASAVLGLLQSAGLLKGLTAAAAALDLHAYLGSLSLYATTFHAVVLLWDGYLPFRPLEILIPFASHHQPALVGLGGVAFYIALGVTVTTYLRGRFQPRTWRLIHQGSLAGLAAALLHALLLGSDSHLPAVRYLYGFTTISLAMLLAYRVFKGVRPHADSAGRG